MDYEDYENCFPSFPPCEDDEEPAIELVRVSGAPGYADFDAVLLLETTAADLIPVSVVSFEWEGETEIAVVPSKFVKVVDGNA